MATIARMMIEDVISRPVATLMAIDAINNRAPLANNLPNKNTPATDVCVGAPKRWVKYPYIV